MAHGAGYNVWSWTANTPADIERLALAGVDGIFSDYVDRVRTIAVRTGRGVASPR